MSLNALDNPRRWVGVAIKVNLKEATGRDSGHGHQQYIREMGQQVAGTRRPPRKPQKIGLPTPGMVQQE